MYIAGSMNKALASWVSKPKGNHIPPYLFWTARWQALSDLYPNALEQARFSAVDACIAFIHIGMSGSGSQTSSIRVIRLMVNKLDLQKVRNQSFGQWPEILMGLGIPAKTLGKKRNQPCPACGGTDRFQFIDKGTGRFVCRKLDSLGGDGFTLVMHWLGCDFFTAAKAVANCLGVTNAPIPSSRPTLHASQTKEICDNRPKIARLWEEGLSVREGDAVARYLANRGLTLTHYPAALRIHPSLPYWLSTDNTPTLLGYYPTMLAAILSPDGTLVGIHRTYLTVDGNKADIKHPVTGEALKVKKLTVGRQGDLRGAAIRLLDVSEGKLALAEGIETALAAHEGSNLPCWATVSAWGLSQVDLPASAVEIYIMADNDTSQTGQKAAQKLAMRMLSEGRQVRILTPTKPDTDWLDVMNIAKEQCNG
ncbi:DUF7146 domain-containing protein [Aquitalea pelogenes]|uniref:DUF7146 domain-containing protein n=1 Tax=Aquitalea pelogenes TaxID=1293573 RepID=UPI000B099D06|nr:toprim domain-containing protein [Aquitalea pelogenes]